MQNRKLVVFVTHISSIEFQRVITLNSVAWIEISATDTVLTMLDEESQKYISGMWDVLTIEALFFYIMSFLPWSQLVMLQGSCKFFKFELGHKFVCEEYHIFFAFNRKAMKQLIQHQLLCVSILNLNLATLMKFYFSFLNGIIKEFAFEQDKDISAIDIRGACICILENYSYKNVEYLYSIKHDKKVLENMFKNPRPQTTGILAAVASWDSIYSDELYNQLGNFGCHVERLISDIINMADQQCNDSFDNELTPLFLDTLILSYIYGCIKPLKTLLVDLLSHNEHFQYRISESMDNFQDGTTQNGKLRAMSTSSLWHCWKQLDKTYGGRVFSYYNASIVKMKGRFAFFSDVLCKGEFDALTLFINSYKSRNNNNICKIQDSCCMYGVFCMITAFLRDDLLDDDYYISPIVRRNVNDGIGHIIESFSQALLFLIDPNLILKLKEHLMMNMMIPFNDKELFEFDIKCNPRYHPFHRIKFLWKLCFSSHFLNQFYKMQMFESHDGSQINNDADCISFKLKQMVERLYYCQTQFENLWHLNIYKDLVNDKSTKDSIYQQFRVIIQALFGLCQFECVRNCHCLNHDGYFDLLPQNVNQVVQLSDLLVAEAGSIEKVKKYFVKPQMYEELLRRVQVYLNVEAMCMYDTYNVPLMLDSFGQDTPKSLLIKLYNYMDVVLGQSNS